jgi:hypothetical protein
MDVNAGDNSGYFVHKCGWVGGVMVKVVMTMTELAEVLFVFRVASIMEYGGPEELVGRGSVASRAGIAAHRVYERSRMQKDEGKCARKLGRV